MKSAAQTGSAPGIKKAGSQGDPAFKVITSSPERNPGSQTAYCCCVFVDWLARRLSISTLRSSSLM